MSITKWARYEQPEESQQYIIPSSGYFYPPEELRRYTVNFTITFNPHKFSQVDTLWEGPVYFAKYINRVRHFRCLWFIFEKHKNNYRHLHGQIILQVPAHSTTIRFDTLTNISKWCNARLGRSDFYWNNELKRDSDYPTWRDYCLKESPESIYTVFRDDPQIYTKIAVDFDFFSPQ